MLERQRIRIDLLMEGTQRKADPDLAIRFGEEPHLVATLLD